MNHFPDSALSHHYVQLALGRRLERAGHGASLELGHHYSMRSGQSLFEGFTLRSTAHWRWSQGVTVAGDASVREMSYARLRFLDGYFSQLGSSLIMSPTAHQRWILRAGLTRYQARESAYSYTQPGLSLRLVREWPGGWITGLQGQTLSARFDAPDPFFGAARRDQEFRLDVDLLNRHLTFFKLTPRLLFGYARRSSNLALYDFQRHYVRLGLTRDY